MPDEAWNAFWAGDPFEQVAENGAFSEMWVYFLDLHRRVLEAFAGVSDAELASRWCFGRARLCPCAFACTV